MTKHDELQKQIKDAGLKPFDVLREAKVPNDTFYNWKRKEPKSFETERKIKQAIETLKDEKESKPAIV